MIAWRVAQMDRLRRRLISLFRASGYENVNEPLRHNEVLRVVQRLEDMPSCAISVVAPDPSKPRFYLRVTRTVDESGYSETYAIYDCEGFWAPLFQPAWFGLAPLTDKEIAHILDRVKDAMWRMIAFFANGDAGLRSCARKAIKIIPNDKW